MKNYVCVECNPQCGTCKGQSDPDESGVVASFGEEGDRAKCVTCSYAYRFLVRSLEDCYPSCRAGQYEKLNQQLPLPSECDFCQEPCRTCAACDPNSDANCDGGDEEAGAKFCTECEQESFRPMDLRDIEEVAQFVTQEASMVRGTDVALSTENEDSIYELYNVTMPRFLCS